MYGLDIVLWIVDVIISLIILLSFYGLTLTKAPSKESFNQDLLPWSWFPLEPTNKDHTNNNNYLWNVFKIRIQEIVYWNRWSFWENKAWFIVLCILLFAVIVSFTVVPQARIFVLTSTCISLLLVFLVIRCIAYFLIEDRSIVQRYSNMKIYQYLFAFGIEFSIFDQIQKLLTPIVGYHIQLVWITTVIMLSILIGFISIYWGIFFEKGLFEFFAHQFLFYVVPFSLGISTSTYFMLGLDSKDKESITLARDTMNLLIVFFAILIWLFHTELKSFSKRFIPVEWILMGVSAISCFVPGFFM